MRKCCQKGVWGIGIMSLCLLVPMVGQTGEEVSGQAGGSASAVAMDITLPPLPYAENALEPYISAKTMSFHYGKHHAGYVAKTNAAIAGTMYANMPLTEIMELTAHNDDAKNIFNNAAQVWNHTFFWNSMQPNGGGEPADAQMKKMINTSFGSYDSFRAAFIEKAAGLFGSGWAWLVHDGEKLEVISTPDAYNPLVDGLQPLICIDVWEHAYYLDYQNRRSDFIAAYLDHLVNWDFAASNYTTAAESGSN